MKTLNASIGFKIVTPVALNTAAERSARFGDLFNAKIRAAIKKNPLRAKDRFSRMYKERCEEIPVDRFRSLHTKKHVFPVNRFRVQKPNSDLEQFARKMIAKSKHPGFAKEVHSFFVEQVLSMAPSYFTRDEMEYIDLDAIADRIFNSYLFHPALWNSVVRNGAFFRKNKLRFRWNGMVCTDNIFEKVISTGSRFTHHHP